MNEFDRIDDLEEDVHKTQEEKVKEKDMEEKEKQRDVIDRIVRGKNDTFSKSYDLEEEGIKFHISIKAPNIIEQGRIKQKTEQYLYGTGSYQDSYTKVIFNTLSLIRETGVDVPDILKSDDDIYHSEILYRIGVDFAEWLNNFRY